MELYSLMVMQTKIIIFHHFAYNKQQCTNVFIMRWVLQIDIIFVSTPPHGSDCNASTKIIIMFFTLLTISNICQMCLS